MSNEITPSDKLFQKCFAFSLTDANTPVLGPFVRKVVTLGTQRGMKYHNLCDVWGGGYDLSQQYPNEPAEWMVGYARKALPNANFTILDKFLDEVKTLEDCLKPPLLAQPLAPAPQAKPVVVEGEVVDAKSEKTASKGPNKKRSHVPKEQGSGKPRKQNGIKPHDLFTRDQTSAGVSEAPARPAKKKKGLPKQVYRAKQQQPTTTTKLQ